MTVGASDASDVYLPGDAAIASHHASVERRKDGYVFTVDPAASAIMVNQQPLAPGTSVLLQGGEHLRIGTTPMIFRLDGMEEA
jgi:predicted component of type VI protein secretion system